MTESNIQTRDLGPIVRAAEHRDRKQTRIVGLAAAISCGMLLFACAGMPNRSIARPDQAAGPLYIESMVVRRGSRRFIENLRRQLTALHSTRQPDGRPVVLDISVQRVVDPEPIENIIPGTTARMDMLMRLRAPDTGENLYEQEFVSEAGSKAGGILSVLINMVSDEESVYARHVGDFVKTVFQGNGLQIHAGAADTLAARR